MSEKCSLRYCISFLRIRGQRLELEEDALKEYFCNDTPSCFSCRNLSSASQQTRQKMRECHGLVDSMVSYINSSLEVGKSEDKVRSLVLF